MALAPLSPASSRSPVRDTGTLLTAEVPAVRKLVAATDQILHRISVVGWRLGFFGVRGLPPLPLLRGVFGAALNEVDTKAYEEVFRPDAEDGAPGYLLRRAPHQLRCEHVVEMVLFRRTIEHLDAVSLAWKVAGERGLGRRRAPFRVEHLAWLDPWGRPCGAGQQEGPFELDLASWPLAGEPDREPCRLLFPEPLRLLRDHRLLEQPTLRDLAVAACRRLGGLVEASLRPEVRVLQTAALEAADAVVAMPFVGERDSVGRWSASQGQHIELTGVRGHLDLPEGPGPLWRLMAALQWVHAGKGTVLGMGRVVVTPTW